MREGIPTIYWAFRWGWSVLQLAILAVLLESFIVWAVTDNQGAEAFSSWLGWIEHLRNTLSSLLPYPWR